MQSSTSFAVPTKLSKKDTPEAKYTITTTAASFATGPLRRRVLIAFMILTEANNNKTVRVLYSNPGPSHVVTNRFPVERFVFPPYGEGRLRRSLSFTFVITTSDGERVYGHTMHTVNGEAMVCLSAHPWCSYFQRVMHLYRVNGTEEGLKMIRSLLERGQQSSSLHAPPNAPPQSLRASGSGDFNAMPVLSDETVSPVIVASPASLLHSFTTDQLFQILGALLTERRVIIVGPTYGSTTNVMMSLLALLAPFEWQHTLITVLPAEMALVLAAPTPYFVGIVASQQHILESTPLEGVVIVQLEHEVAATNAPYEEYGATDSERRLVCSNILYHEESPHTLPLTGMTESRIRWQLQLFRRAPQMRRTNATMEIDPAESYSKGTNMCAHDMLCQIFMSYYASWIGPRLSQWIEDRGKPVAATPANNNGVAAATSPQEVTGDAGFFAMLEESQCYQELMYRLSDVLHHSNSAAGITNAARDEGVQTSAATINNPYSPTTSMQASLWFLNPFLLTVVQQHPEKFPKKFAELSRPEVLDFGAGLGRNRLHRAASDGHMYKSKTSSRAAVCGAVNLAATYHEHIRVRSLLLRSMSCCTNDIDAATDVEELNDLTPVSSSKSSQ